MATVGLKVLESAGFAFGEQRMRVTLVFAAKKAKPYRVRVVHTKTATKQWGSNVLSAGYTCLEDSEAEARKLYAWTLDQAKAKGWEPGPSRGGGHFNLLSGVPSPHANHPTSPAPALPSRLLQRQRQATGRP